jgi:hypothetical protein
MCNCVTSVPKFLDRKVDGKVNAWNDAGLVNIIILVGGTFFVISPGAARIDRVMYIPIEGLLLAFCSSYYGLFSFSSQPAAFGWGIQAYSTHPSGISIFEKRDLGFGIFCCWLGAGGARVWVWFLLVYLLHESWITE